MNSPHIGVRVVPYEHRGKQIRSLGKAGSAGVDELLEALRAETDPGLRKAIVLSLLGATETSTTSDLRTMLGKRLESTLGSADLEECLLWRLPY